MLEKFLSTNFLALTNTQETKTQQLERDYQHTLAKLEGSQQDLRQRIMQLETLNQEIVEANKAVFALAQKMEVLEQEVTERIMSQIRLLLLPFWEYVRESQETAPNEDHINKLCQFIGGQVDPVPPASLYVHTVLTSQELRIVSMIRQGMTNNDIAERLYIAPTTVKTHRRNIRKKLGLAGAKNRLQTYFQASTSQLPTSL